MIGSIVMGAGLLAADVSAAPFWTVAQGGDACLTAAAMPDADGEGTSGIVAGYDSGRVLCWEAGSTTPTLALWSGETSGSVLAILPFADANGDGRDDVVVADDLGWVRCLRGGTPETGAGQELWSFRSACGVAVLTPMPDLGADSVPEIAVGGAEQILWLLNGKTGATIWSRSLTEFGGYGYIHRILRAGDLNGDAHEDAVLLDWNGDVEAFGGTTGAAVWSKSITGGFTEAMDRAGDMNGDGKADFFAGGNAKRVSLVSGSDGAVVWNCALGRPVRAVIATPDVDDDGTTDCVAVTAGGVVACISGAGSGSKTPRWTANMGDCCRAIVSPGDLDADGKPDVIVGAENGVVAAFSGVSGNLLWNWQGPDVVRSLALVADIGDDGIPDVVATCLDGTLALLPSDRLAWIPLPESGSIRNLLAATTLWTSPNATDLTAPEIVSGSEATSAPPSAAPRESALQQSNATEIAILLYHDVIPVARYPYSVSVENFRQQMDLLVTGGYTCVSLDQIADWIEGTVTLPEKSVCITFDGPYEGHHTHAYPILKERGLFAESYITTDWIGTVNHLDWHQLRQVDAERIEDIQNHTINHVNLASASREVVIEQLTLCNESIRRHLGGKLARHHAYPGGSYNTAVMGILGELGFRTATTVASRRATRSDNLFALPRFGISPTTSLGTFKSWIGYVEPPPPLLPYRFVGTVGTGWSQPSYGDVDEQGRLWVCDYSAGRVRVFEPDGQEASFSPITQGQTQSGQTRSLSTASGIAVTPGGEVLVTIADYLINPVYFGVFVYRASDGAFLRGIDLAYRPGDVDCDATGRYFIVDKVTAEWHVYAADGEELPGSPVGSGTTNHIQRGLSVWPDASRVYVISEADGAVHVWLGEIDGEGCHYSQGPDLVTGLGGASGGVDVMNDGTVLVGDDGQGRLLGFDAANALLGAIHGGTPALTTPRGTAFTPDGTVIWAISRSGFVQRWERVSEVTGWYIW